MSAAIIENTMKSLQSDDSDYDYPHVNVAVKHLQHDLLQLFLLFCLFSRSSYCLMSAYLITK